MLVTAPVKGVPTELAISNEMKAACETLLPPTVETMLDLLSRVEPEFQERVRNNIILSGGGGLTRNLARSLEPPSSKSAAAKSRTCRTRSSSAPMAD